MTDTNTIIQVRFVPHRRFGVELEYNRPANCGDAYGNSDYRGRNKMRAAIQRVPGQTAQTADYIHNHNNSEWFCKTDSSCGLEACSPVGRTVADLKVMGEVLAMLHHRGFRADRQCGNHIHVECSDYTQRQLTVLAAYWSKIEHVVMMTQASHRRSNTHCSMVACHTNRIRPNGTFSPNDLRASMSSDRGQTLNLTNFNATNGRRGSPKRTVEFRFGHMTSDAEEFKNRARFVIQLCEICKHLEAPANLNWFSPKQTLRLLGLLPDEDKVFSDSSLSMRRWFLQGIISNCSAVSHSKDIAQATAMLAEMTGEPVPEVGNEETVMQPLSAGIAPSAVRHAFPMPPADAARMAARFSSGVCIACNEDIQEGDSIIFTRRTGNTEVWHQSCVDTY